MTDIIDEGQQPVFSKLADAFVPTDDMLPCPIEYLHPLHPAIIKKQATINIGTIGHVAHGKTTLVKSISGKDTVKFIEEKKRNITIKLGYANAKIFKCDNPLCPAPECYACKGSEEPGDFPCPRKGCGGIMRLVRHISFVDCPGHEALMKTMLSGAAVMDSAVMLIAANEDFPQNQTQEHLAAVQQMQVSNVIIVQNKIDLKPASEIQEQHNKIQSWITENATSTVRPIIPASAQLNININYIVQSLVTHIPIPVRDFISPPRLSVVRSFDVNRPGSSIAEITGGVAGGSLLCGVLKKGMPIEFRPGFYQDGTGSMFGSQKGVLHQLTSRIVSLKAEENELDFAVPGGLIGVGTELDPFLCKSDRLVGQVLGLPGTLPKIYVAIEIEFSLLTTLLEGKKGEEEQRIEQLFSEETLLLNVGSKTVSGTVDKVSGKKCRLSLREPVCTTIGELITLSRKFDKRWRLIGNGRIVKGRKLE